MQDLSILLLLTSKATLLHELLAGLRQSGNKLLPLRQVSATCLLESPSQPKHPLGRGNLPPNRGSPRRLSSTSSRTPTRPTCRLVEQGEVRQGTASSGGGKTDTSHEFLHPCAIVETTEELSSLGIR